jgi:pimeloyl-ACP methyl ester carboxylesterase
MIDEMARFVLVHGAFGGAWSWAPVVTPLEAAGHSVETLDLPGGRKDRTPVADVTLESCSERVCAQLRRGVAGLDPSLLRGDGPRPVDPARAAAAHDRRAMLSATDELVGALVELAATAPAAAP